MKVVENMLKDGFKVVPDDYGEKRIDSTGSAYSYEPIAICFVHPGHGRTLNEAKALAQRIANLLTLDDELRPTAVIRHERLAGAAS